MLDALDMHEPLLINTIGHSVGLLLFTAFLILVLRERRTGPSARGSLPAIAATLALLWNAGSLLVLAASSGLVASSDLVASLSFAILSLLPAVLLQFSLAGKLSSVWMTGYAVSAIAVGLHMAELAKPDASFHQAALWVVIVGFGLLTVIAMFLAHRPSPARIPVSMCLFLFAISFVHFSPGHVRYAWSSEIALHHAGIPLALYVLLQDYRFLLLDTFLRFLANAVVASGLIVLSLVLNARFQILDRVGHNLFLQGVVMVGACLALAALVLARGRLQLFLTRVVFRRPDREPAIRAIRESGSKAESEKIFLDSTAPIISAFLGAAQSKILDVNSWEEQGLPAEPALVESTRYPAWVEVSVPLRFMKGDGALILLGRREGGRRYLSEDLQELARLAAVVVEQVERFRNSEIQRLVSQAELRALQSQINPHFLFNSLNTLYGTIPRDAADARRMALSLAEIFRYFLQSNRTFVPLTEEIQIIQAYLQIESLRLGNRLKTEIAVDESAGRALIPVLSIQPLIENAVKYGVAHRLGPGTVRLRVRTVPNGVKIEVSDDGGGFQQGERKGTRAGGVGLENVRQRLKLCFGPPADLSIESTDHGCTVSFLIPGHHAFAAIPQEVSA
jgi:two-component system LytT family sensor kinase